MKKVSKKEELFYDGKIYYRIAFKDKSVVWLYPDLTSVIDIRGFTTTKELEDQYQVDMKADGQ